MGSHSDQPGRCLRPQQFGYVPQSPKMVTRVNYLTGNVMEVAVELTTREQG
jgi:hypothetical protein